MVWLCVCVCVMKTVGRVMAYLHLMFQPDPPVSQTFLCVLSMTELCFIQFGCLMQKQKILFDDAKTVKLFCQKHTKKRISAIAKRKYTNLNILMTWLCLCVCISSRNGRKVWFQLLLLMNSQETVFFSYRCLNQLSMYQQHVYLSETVA